MGKNDQGSALKRVLNRSLGITEKAMWYSQETVDLDDAYRRLLTAYDAIPDFDDDWVDIQGRHDKLKKAIQDLETTHVTNTPKARTDHTDKIEAQILLAKQLKVDIENEDKARAKRRIKALKDCAAVKVPAGANDAQRLRLSQQRQKINALLPATDLREKHLVDAAKEQVALLKLAKEIASEVGARQTFDQRQKDVTAALKAAAHELEGAAETHLQGLLNAAILTGTNATDAAGWKQAVTELDAVALKTTQAQAFGVQYERLSKLAVNYTNAAPPLKLAQLNQLITDAQNLAAAHNYVAATQKLVDFEADPDTQDVKAFYARLALFRANVGAKMAVLQKKSLPNTPANLKPNDELQAIKNSCIGNATAANYQNATAALGVFEQRLLDSHAYALRYNELHAFSTSPDFALLASSEQLAITQALSQAKGLADGNPGDPGQALSKLQPPAIDATKVAQPVAVSKLAAQVQGLYNGLLAVAPGSAAELHIKGLMDAAQIKFTGKDFPAAEGLFTTLLPLARAALLYAEHLKEAQAAVLAVTLSGKPDVLKAATDKAATQAYGEALPLIKDGLKTLDDFVAYRARLDELATLKAVLPLSATEALAQIDEALLEADGLAKAGAFADALSALEPLAQLPDLEGPLQEISAYQQQRQAMAGPYASTIKDLPVPEARIFLQKFWDEADTLAGQRKHKEALKKLTDLQGHLPLAQRFTAERQGAQAVNKSLIDLHTAGKGVYTVTDTQVVMSKFLSDADAAAKTGGFPSALKKLSDFRAKAKVLCGVAAVAHDTTEGTSNIHPHSVSKHLNVTDTDKETRVKTGVPPPPTQAASSFDDAEGWMAAREAATDKGKTRAGYKLTDDNTTPVPHLTSIAIHVEHHRPIGSAMIGVKEKTAPKQSGPNKGELGGGNTYERAVKVSGYTRSTSVFRFDAHASPQGKWVLLTQYPYTDSWDPELGCYTEPLPD